jgi:hypothetical protein
MEVFVLVTSAGAAEGLAGASATGNVATGLATELP